MPRQLTTQVCLWTTLLMIGITGVAMADYFVSLQGNDAHPGTKTKPFATLEKARDAVRDASPQGPVTVWLRGGVYRRERPFELTNRDSGVSYKAFGTERVSLMGGVALPPGVFGAVTDEAVVQRLDAEARPHILVADLTALGLTDFGGDWPNNFRGYNGWPELFFNGKRMQLARWPNKGFARMGKVLDKGSVPRVGEKPDRPGKFQYEGDRPERWLTADEVYLDGYWCFKWYNDVLKVAKIDPAEKSIAFAVPHVYGIGGYSGGEYFALNLLEELDAPGEYYLDRKTGLLYLWPPGPPANASVALSTLQDPLITVADASQVTIQGLTLEVSCGPAIRMTGGESNLIAGCTIRNLASDAISISGGTNNGVAGCDMYHLGGGGISLSGGDRATLTPCGNFAHNNHIHHFGELYRTHHDAINLNGCGCKATHNLIHDAPHHAMDFGGNDHLVEFNEVYRVCLETDDAGAIYTGRRYAWQGTVIRYNFWHDIGGGPAVGNQAIYLDDCASGTTCVGNVVYRVGRAFLIGGGRDNIAENNIIVDCRIPMHIDNRGIGSANTKDENWQTMTEDFKTMPWQGELWSRRYPHLPKYLEDQPGYPKHNRVVNNLIVRCGQMNLAKEAQELSTIADNFTTDDDPGFVEAARLDFALKPDAAVFKQLPGFKPIPFEQIGPELDQYRKHLPLLLPNIDPAPQSFVGELAVKIGTRYPGAVVRYTLDGSEPNEKSPVYSKPLKLTKTTTVRAQGYQAGEATEVAEATYRLMQLGPGHGVYLGELEPALVSVHGELKRDTNYSGQPIKIQGKQYAHGLSTHPETAEGGGKAEVVYDLKGWLQAARTFTAVVGIDDSAVGQGSCAFIVELRRGGQWERAFESPVIRGGQAPAEVKADLAGADGIRLLTTDGGDNIYSDHAVWAEARVQ